jgi:transposase-like protein
VLRLLRGKDLELLSRELGVVASTLSLWREQFLAAGQLSLKGKTGQADERDEQISRLKKKVGELTMDNELLREKAQRLQRTSLWHAGGRGDESGLLDLHR